MTQFTAEDIRKAYELIQRAGLRIIEGDFVSEEGVDPLVALYITCGTDDPEQVRDDHEFLRSMHWTLVQDRLDVAFGTDYVTGFYLGWDNAPPDDLEQILQEDPDTDASALYDGYTEGQIAARSVPK